MPLSISHRRGARRLALGLLLLVVSAAVPAAAQRLVTPIAGRFGGTLTIAQSSEPQTLNPVFATDNASRLAVSLMMADLMHINPRTTEVEPALATGVDHVSALKWIVHLRRGVRFSDGVPLTAADVVFSFEVYTDAKLDPPQRPLLVVKGVPVRARGVDADTVEIDLPAPLAVGDRLFDSLWILPRHKLESLFRAGKLADAWDPGVAPAQLAGLGPWVLQSWTAGREMVFARNPNFWQADRGGRPLPFLDTLRVRTVTDANLQLTMLTRGEIDGLELRSQDYAALRNRSCCRLLDAGAGLDPIVLVLNQAPVSPPAGGANSPTAAARSWFRQLGFRQGVSASIDRANLVRNVFGGAAAPLATITSPAERGWSDGVKAPGLDPALAQRDFQQAGFHLDHGRLADSQGRAVTFSLIVPASNPDRMQVATFVQEDLRRAGIAVQVVPLEFSAYVDRLLHRRDFDAAIVGLGFPDADPNVESAVWTLDGNLHLWNAAPADPLPWERELDRLFFAQLTTLDGSARLDLYRRMQAIEREQLPLIALVAPDVLAAAKPGLAGAQAALLAPHLWWNTADLYWAGAANQ